MKRLLVLVLALTLFTSVNAQNKNVLFLGNSYTYVNDLPTALETLALTFGDTLIHDQNTPGGYTMNGHSTNAVTLSKIAAGGWDFVSIQSQSQEPSFSPAQVTNDVYPYAEIICDSIESADNCAEPLFFMTWGRKNGDAGNCASYPPVCTYEGMQQRLRSSYIEMAQDNDGSVSPVGAVWQQVRDSLPGLELYSPDESHPSVAGTYVAACTFYASIWRKSPVGSSYISSLTAADALAIQTLATRVVLDSLSNWNIGHGDAVASLTSSHLFGLTYEFDATNSVGDSLFWSFGDGAQDTTVTGVHSHAYAGNGTYNIQLIASNQCHSDTLNYELVISPFMKINEIEINLVVFPNPVTNMLSVNSDQPIQQYSLFDYAGKLLIEKQVNNKKELVIDLTTYSDGIYQLEIISNDSRVLRKLIKQ
ncbi:MAG: hypothetical protein ACI9J3_002467 [Parvicellaceae bacterium]|jgi:hypothetical protein